MYFDLQPEAVENHDQPMSSGASEIGTANAREIGRRDDSDSYLLGERERPPLIHAEIVGGTPNVLMTEQMLAGSQILGGLIDRR